MLNDFQPYNPIEIKCNHDQFSAIMYQEQSPEVVKMDDGTNQLESGPSMRELYSAERLADIPPGFVQGEHDLKDHNGIFCGREAELKRITTYFGDQWLAEDQGQTGDRTGETMGFAHIITNAPGAGKSTLLIEFALRQTLRGVACPLLAAGDFESESKVIKSLHRFAQQNRDGIVPLWLERPVRWAIEHEDVSRLNALGFVAAGDLVGAATAKSGIPPLQKIAQRLLKAFGRGRPDNLTDALMMVSDATDGRFIVMVDECHKWLLPGTDRAAVRANLEQIADKMVRKANGIRGGALLAAGLGSVTRRQDELGLTRAGTTWLGPLSTEESRATIARTIRSSQTSEARRQRILESWGEQLASDFSSWLQHTAAAAVTAQHLLQATHPGCDEGDAQTIAGRDAQHLEWVRTMTAGAICRLYDQRVEAASQAAGTWAAPALAALATQHGNRIPAKAVHEAVRLILLNDSSRDDGQKLTTQDGLTQILGTGLIRYSVQPDTLLTDLGYMEFAMPSLRRYITEVTANSNPQEMAWAEEMAENATLAAARKPKMDTDDDT